MARPGFGKRSVPGQGPRRRGDFAHLPERESAIAAYIDRLPDGACIAIKALAAQLPYGQCALGTALRRLAEAGHLRLFKEHVEGGMWITRTHFSRVPRGDAWWAAYHAGRDMDRWQAGEGADTAVTADAPGVPNGPEAADVPNAAEPGPRTGQAYRVLARLGEADSRLTLSAADCAALQGVAEEWLRRGASEQGLTSALTAGLPEPVYHPRRFVEKRLTAKMPPVREAPERRTVPLLMECVVCRAPGRPEALPGGVCHECGGRRRTENRLPAVDAERHAAGIRVALRGLRVATARSAPAPTVG
ncbi:hypothetical protein [Streptomyces sp. NPDC059850]|uniref:hypothetical protein n=1 Tax=Streptomyces sp. NPDC059850 TaxID=3346970 RepID=UPI00365417A3